MYIKIRVREQSTGNREISDNGRGSRRNPEIAYMVENGIDTEITDSAKITYKSQARSTLDKKRLEEDLGNLGEYTKTTFTTC